MLRQGLRVRRACEREREREREERDTEKDPREGWERGEKDGRGGAGRVRLARVAYAFIS